MENNTHCPKCDVQLIYKPSINICPNCGWDSEEDYTAGMLDDDLPF